MPLQIIRNDITKMEVGAIVNAANSKLKMGGGVCGAIFNAAGPDALQKECDAIGGCNTGDAVITKGYNLPAKHIIHAVGPIWNGGNNNEEKLLRNCYLKSLKLALDKGIESIAFPLISSGIYGYPKDQAFRVAVAAIQDFLLRHEMMVYLIVFDKKAVEIGEKLYKSIEEYIVVFVIVTDGMENSSKEYTYDKIKEMIEHQKSKYSWEFMFLGANIDAVKTAENFGIAEDRATNFVSDSDGTRLNYKVVSDVVRNLRKGREIDENWDFEIQKYYDERM